MEAQGEFEQEMENAIEYVRALMRKDREEADRLRPLVKYEAEGLMLFKNEYGAEYVRSRGYNTEKADKKYGPGWLDREDALP